MVRLRDIDDLALTPSDLSGVLLDGSPASATVDGVAVSPSGDGSFDLRGAVAPRSRSVVEWDGGSARVTCVAYHYCGIDEVLDWGDDRAQSPRRAGRTEDDALRARAVAERTAEHICGRTFRATPCEETFHTDGTHQLAMPASAVATQGATLLADGLVELTHQASDGSYPVAYVAGRDDGVPPDLRGAVARLAASYLVPSRVPERASSESTDAGFIRYTLADRGSTGLPNVDAVLLRYARERWCVA